MTEFNVSWSIDVDADDPEDAARLAESMYIKTSNCRVYEVRQWEPDIGHGSSLSMEVTNIDLDEL